MSAWAVNVPLMKMELLLVVLVQLIAIMDSVRKHGKVNMQEVIVATMIGAEKVLLAKKMIGKKKFATEACAKLMRTASNGVMNTIIAILENAGDQI